MVRRHVRRLPSQGYIRDPGGAGIGLTGNEAVISYDPDTRLPANARWTGWYRDGERLYVSPSDRVRGEYRNVYVVWPDHVERLPLFLPGCA
jgi:hypothetical protein